MKNLNILNSFRWIFVIYMKVEIMQATVAGCALVKLWRFYNSKSFHNKLTLSIGHWFNATCKDEVTSKLCMMNTCTRTLHDHDVNHSRIRAKPAWKLYSWPRLSKRYHTYNHHNFQSITSHLHHHPLNSETNNLLVYSRLWNWHGNKSRIVTN